MTFIFFFSIFISSVARVKCWMILCIMHEDIFLHWLRSTIIIKRCFICWGSWNFIRFDHPAKLSWSQASFRYDNRGLRKWSASTKWCTLCIFVHLWCYVGFGHQQLFSNHSVHILHSIFGNEQFLHFRYGKMKSNQNVCNAQNYIATGEWMGNKNFSRGQFRSCISHNASELWTN